MSCTKNQCSHKILVLEELPKMPSAVAKCCGKYYCSQKCQKQIYLSELALKHKCKSETKQTSLVGSTCILEQKVDPSVHIWRMKLRWEHHVGLQFHRSTVMCNESSCRLLYCPSFPLWALFKFWLCIPAYLPWGREDSWSAWKLFPHTNTEVNFQLFSNFLHNLNHLFTKH